MSNSYEHNHLHAILQPLPSDSYSENTHTHTHTPTKITWYSPYLVGILPTLGSPAVARSGRVRAVGASPRDQEEDDTEGGPHAGGGCVEGEGRRGGHGGLLLRSCLRVARQACSWVGCLPHARLCSVSLQAPGGDQAKDPFG